MEILPPQIRAAAGRKFVLLCAAGTQIRATVWVLLEKSFQQKKKGTQISQRVPELWRFKVYHLIFVILCVPCIISVANE